MSKDIHFKLCSPKDLKSIIRCQKKVIETITDKSLYFPCTSVELEYILSCSLSNGFILGSYNNQELFGFVAIQKWTDFNYYGYDCNHNREYYSIEDTVVLSKYRGLGMQYNLWSKAFTYLPKLSVILCTIHPLNTASLSNALKLGFTSHMQCYPYDDSPRIIFEKHTNG